MTDHRHGPGAGPEEALRRALHDVVAELPTATGLVDGMHRRAARIRRRRAVAGTAALATGLVTFGVLVAVPPWDGAAPTTPSVRTVAPPPPTAPSRPDPEPTIGLPTATSADDPPDDPSPDGGTTPDRAQGATLDDGFDGDALDPARWVAYIGDAEPVGRWDPDALAVRDGRLRISVTARGGSGVRDGGLKSVAARAHGRWEVRWRMTPGRAAIAQLVLLGDGPGGVRYAATLDPDAGTLTLRDTVRDEERTVPVDAGSFHRVALERTAATVRWLLDGEVVAEHEPGPRGPALLLGLQAFVADPGCVDSSPCDGPEVAVLEVDGASVGPRQP